MASSGVFRRIYLVRPLSAAILSLPGLLLCLWYGWSAFTRFDHYRRASGREAAFTLEGFHIQLFDILRRDLRRMLMPPRPEPSRIERFSFQISSENLDGLLKGAEREAGRRYLPARLVRGASLQPVQMRLRGQRHWHVAARQKSLKVRLPKGSLLFGNRIFNLINEPGPMVVGDQTMLDILSEHGVLTPLSFFARVDLNGADLGIYHYESQPEESLLRLNQRMPGSMYSGNLPPSAETAELWSDVNRWKKVAWRGGERKKPPDDLERLLTMISSATVSQFADFARYEMDLRAFATLDAVDVAFGVDQHNFRENHKLYFDPYRGRWEPIAWNLRGFRDDPVFNLVENPVLLRLKLVPGFLSLRNRILYQLLVGDGAVSSVRARASKMLRKLAPELATDPYWDAYMLLSPIDWFHRRMLRPMDLRRAALVLESEMTTYEGRHDFLVRELQRNAFWHAIEVGETADRTLVKLIIDGRAGVKLERFRLDFSHDCHQVSWRVLRNGVPVTPFSSDDQAELVRPLDLFTAVRLVKRENPSRTRGEVRTRAVPVAYPFAIESSCIPQGFWAEGIHLATGSRVKSRPAGEERLAALPRKRLSGDEVPEFEPGETSAHPWSLPMTAARSVQIGPGIVEVPETRIFTELETVEVAPGTRLRMGPGASLVFLGKVSFRGAQRQPIIIEGSGSTPWGGIALQGRETRGSRLEYVEMSGGSVPQWRLVPYPGMLDFHDTADITVRRCRFAANQRSDDVLHTAYVKNLLIEDSEIKKAASDAVDLEFTRGVLRRVKIVDAGDDGLDLMGSRVEILDSTVVACGGNGISSGEESRVTVRNSLVAGARVGVLAKNGSAVDLFGSLLYANRTGIDVYKRTVRYQGDSHVKADVLFVVNSKRAIKRDDLGRDRLDTGRILQSLPRDGMLDHLADNVLGLEKWENLASLVETMTENGGAP